MKTKVFSLAMSVSLLAFLFHLTSCGPSKAVLAIQAEASIEEVQGLENKLIWLQANAKGGNYVIELDSDEQVTSAVEQLPRGTITLRGVGANRTISYASAGMLSKCPRSMFSVGVGTTLILDNNITLKTEKCSMTLVSVRGTFVMNDGSAITGGNSRSGGGGGVYVGDGTFLMKGGTISGNTNYRGYLVGGMGGATAGRYFVHTFGTSFGGGGIYVSHVGTFIKTGGTIANNSVQDIRPELTFKNERGDLEIRIPNTATNGGKFIQENGYAPVNGFGSQIYFQGENPQGENPQGENPKSIDNAVGPEMNIHFSKGVFSEGEKEESAPVANEPAPSDVPVETQAED